MGVANVILGVIKFSRTFDWLVLFYSHYVEQVLDKFFKGGNSTIKTPMDINVNLSKNKCNGIN